MPELDPSNHSEAFLAAVSEIAAPALGLPAKVEALAEALSKLCGRLFIIGVGGSAANASHAVADFRRLCTIEAYAATDNAAELTARTNDDGWKWVFSGWLAANRMKATDALLVLSVGGGNEEVSPNLVRAIDFAATRRAPTYAIVGRNDGYAATETDLAIVIPEVNPQWITPLSESFQLVILHCLVSHPKLQKSPTKW